MNCEPLKKHIIDTVKEWQMKIGYRAESMSFITLRLPWRSFWSFRRMQIRIS